MTEQELLAFFRDLHQHPELGMQEFRTAGKVREQLRLAGVPMLETGLPTGIIAVIKGAKPGKVIGLRGDMDALPIQEESGLPYASCEQGVMHACGHDFHTSCMLGAALMLWEQREELAGTVKVVFQPAEEIAIDAGGKLLRQTGLLNDCEEIYGIHSYPQFQAGTIGIKEGPVMAAPDRFVITLQGRGAHAAQPQKGVDPIPALAALVLGLQTVVSRNVNPFDNAVITVAHIQAGSTYNVIPETAFLEGTVRTLNPAVREMIKARLYEIAQGTAAAYGCTLKYQYDEGPDAVINDSALCAAAAETAREMGFLVDRQEDTMGGEDFSEYLKICPGVFIRVGTGGDYPAHHPRFTVDPAALWPAARYFASLARKRAESISPKE
ncbi:MAG: amidohydrolase [Clostridia bacterium]|nr:amidohydrolase [Clostridia bacterium]